MSKTDRELYAQVRDEALSLAGISWPVRCVVIMVEKLAETYGDQFTLDGAQDALTQMIRSALIFKDELRKAQEGGTT